MGAQCVYSYYPIKTKLIYKKNENLTLHCTENANDMLKGSGKTFRGPPEADVRVPITGLLFILSSFSFHNNLGFILVFRDNINIAEYFC